MQHAETPSPEEVQDTYGKLAEQIGESNADVVAGLKEIFGKMEGGGTPDEITSFLRAQEASDREWLTGEILRLDEETRAAIGINHAAFAEIERGFKKGESTPQTASQEQPVRERAPRPQPTAEPAFGTEQA